MGDNIPLLDIDIKFIHVLIFFVIFLILYYWLWNKYKIMVKGLYEIWKYCGLYKSIDIIFCIFIEICYQLRFLSFPDDYWLNNCEIWSSFFLHLKVQLADVWRPKNYRSVFLYIKFDPSNYNLYGFLFLICRQKTSSIYHIWH